MTEFSPEYIEGLKKQARQYYEDEGLEWRGKIVSLRYLNPLTGNLESISLDFRDEAVETVKLTKRKRRPRQGKRRQRSQSVGLAE